MLTARMLKRALVIGLVVGLAVACAKDGGSVASPVVRVDLGDQIPEKFRKRALSSVTLQCTEAFTLSDGGAAQKLVANWRVLDIDGALFVKAVEVVADGPTTGAGAPTATASVGEATSSGPADKPVTAVTVRVGWRAQKGCGSVAASRKLVLAASSPRCKRPKKMKIFGDDAAPTK